MNGQADDRNHDVEEAERRPFQFGLKHLLALPVVVALFFALVAYLGKVLGVLVFLLVIGLLLPRTRDRTLIVIALLLMAALVLILSELPQ